MKKEKWKGP